jgi:nucleoside-diphosphate-sugar epimerase
MNFDDVEVVERNEVESASPNIVNFISTVDNYNVYEDSLLDIQTNLVHFMKILDGGRKKWGERLVFNQISTWFVYSNAELPAKETSLCDPKGFYSITAFARENLLRSYCETFGLKYRILRLGNVIGIGDKKASRKKNALQWMIKELAEGRDVSVYKGGAIRDYIDVRDCVGAIRLVLEKGELNQVYNISNGKGLNVKDLVDVAHRESGYIGKVGTMEVPDFHNTVQIKHMWLDNSKLRSLGYVQRHDIKETVRELVRYYKQQG